MLLDEDEIGKEDNLIKIENDDERTPMITPSDIIEHLFCPRFTYFIHILKIPQYEEKRYKVMKGRELHEQKEEFLKNYLRQKVNCVKKDVSIYLADPKIGVRGVVDEVLYLEDGSLSPLDYKFAEYNDYLYKTHKVQSTIYALLIKSNYKKEVKKGFVIYCRSKNKLVEIFYKESDFCYALKVVREIFDVIQKSYYPKGTTYQSRCIDCCYKNICV